MLRTRINEAREQGFTLIELLIVIVVLGVLAGIVVLGVGQFKTDATTAACKASQDNAQIAFDAWQTANPAAGVPTIANINTYVKATSALVAADWTITAAGIVHTPAC
jgi:general secretion pathway protein G